MKKKTIFFFTLILLFLLGVFLAYQIHQAKIRNDVDYIIPDEFFEEEEPEEQPHFFYYGEVVHL